MSEATLWPESIVILVNINGLRSVTSTNTRTVQKRTIDQIPPKAKKYRIQSSKITNQM